MTENILEYENLVLSYANKFRYHYDIEDLKQVGMMGLMKAIENYKPGETKFTTYAYLWIKGEILKYIREDRNLKVNQNFIKISKTIEDVKNTLRHQLLREPTLEEISLFSEIDISLIQEVEMSKEFVLSLDYIINSDDEGKDLDLYNTVSYYEQGYDSEILDLKDALGQLDPDEQKLIQYRYFDDMTQSEASKRLGVTQVKVSREEAKILKKLNQMVA